MIEKLAMTDLEDCFDDAIRNEMNYIGVLIQMQGFAEPEVIINQTANFEAKLAYYQKAHNEDLTLKTFDGVKIIGFACANTYEELEDMLVNMLY